MLSNFPKTTSEHWRKTPGTQKGSPFSSKGDRTKYKSQKETQELGTETSPGEGVVKGEKFPNIRKPSHQWVCGEFWNLRGQHKVKERKKVNSLSCVRHFATLWTVAYQGPLSMGFSRQEYGVGCHCLLQGIFPTQGLNPGLPHCGQMLYPLSH